MRLTWFLISTNTWLKHDHNPASWQQHGHMPGILNLLAIEESAGRRKLRAQHISLTKDLKLYSKARKQLPEQCFNPSDPTLM